MKLLDAEALAALPLPRLDGDSDKDERGRVLAVGGSDEVPGGILLAAVASLRVGAGKLQIATAEAAAAGMAIAVPEARVIALQGKEPSERAASVLQPLVENADALILGPGMFDEDAAGRLACILAKSDGKAAFLLDAAAITGLKRPSDLAPVANRVVLTPHAGEMAKFMGRERKAVEADAAACALEAARQWSAVVALKGETTYIATPDGDLWKHPDGPQGLATSGSGDVLAGIVGGLLARGAPPATAACWGVYLHAAAGRRLTQTVGPLGFLARELLDPLPGLLHGLGGS